ncbi:MAG: NrfD/PsrC family molybdoenzyme membrane anchor subunit, partial [Fervidicoccaceae archaeon]
MRRMYALLTSLALLIVGVVLGFIGFRLKEVGEIAWGFLVPGYMFFAMTAAGAALVTLAPSLFGFSGKEGELRSLRKLALWFAAGTLIPSWFLILLDLSRPPEFVEIFLSFNPSSRIAWMGVLYLTTFIVLVVELIYAIVKEERGEGVQGKALGGIILTIVGTIVELLLISNLSQVFGVVQTFPAWHGSYLVAIFIAASLLLGSAGMSLFGAMAMRGREKERSFLASYYGKMLIASSMALVLLLFWDFLSAYYTPEAWASLSRMVNGSYALSFWFAVVLGLVAAPLLAGIASKRRSISALAFSSALSLIFGIMLLYLIIVVPQTVYFDVIPEVTI